MNATHPPVRRVVILADRDVTTLESSELGRLADVAAGSHVLVVTPAGAVAGERWIIDLNARNAKARERADLWVAALAVVAGEVDVEIGDENPRLALSDARRAFAPHEVLNFPRGTKRSIGETSTRARVVGQPTAPRRGALPIAA